MLHIFHCTAGMRGDEIRYKLKSQPMFLDNFVEFPLQPLKKSKSWFIHQIKHMTFSMLRCNLQTPRGMMENKLLKKFARTPLFKEAITIEEEIITYSTAYIGMLYALNL